VRQALICERRLKNNAVGPGFGQGILQGQRQWRLRGRRLCVAGCDQEQSDEGYVSKEDISAWQR